MLQEDTDSPRYGHALRVLAILLRSDEPRERVATRLEKIADEVDSHFVDSEQPTAEL